MKKYIGNLNSEIVIPNEDVYKPYRDYYDKIKVKVKVKEQNLQEIRLNYYLKSVVWIMKTQEETFNHSVIEFENKPFDLYTEINNIKKNYDKNLKSKLEKTDNKNTYFINCHGSYSINKLKKLDLYTVPDNVIIHLKNPLNYLYYGIDKNEVDTQLNILQSQLSDNKSIAENISDLLKINCYKDTITFLPGQKMFDIDINININELQFKDIMGIYTINKDKIDRKYNHIEDILLSWLIEGNNIKKTDGITNIYVNCCRSCNNNVDDLTIETMYIYENFIKQLNNSLLNIGKPSKIQKICKTSHTVKTSLSTPINPKTGRNSRVTSKENKTNSERINKIIIFYKKIKQSSTEKNEIIKTLINKTIFSDEEIQGLSNYILGGDKIKQKFGIINFIYTNITKLDDKTNFINKIYLFCLVNMNTNFLNINEMLIYLIKNYIDIIINIHGTTNLYDFVYNNKIDMIEIFSKHSTFDPNMKDINNFYTLLNYKFTIRFSQHYYFYENDIETLKYLLSLPNININYKNVNGLSVLHYAIMNYYSHINYNNDYLFIKDSLLTHPNIDVNIKDNTGKTPLYYAIIQNNIELVKLLLSHHDIDVNIKDNTGKSLLDIALDIESTTKYSKIVELLKTHLLNNKK